MNTANNNVFTDSNLATRKVEANMRALYPKAQGIHEHPLANVFEGFTELDNTVYVSDLIHVDNSGSVQFDVDYYTPAKKDPVFRVAYRKEYDAEVRDYSANKKEHALSLIRIAILEVANNHRYSAAERTVRMLGLSNTIHLVNEPHLAITDVQTSDTHFLIVGHSYSAQLPVFKEVMGETGNVSDSYIIAYNR